MPDEPRAETVGSLLRTEDVVRAARSAPTLEQTLKRLARREMLTDPDKLNESGVRHLKLEVLRRRRSRRATA